MSSIFAQTIAKAINEYRTMLRRYLSQTERVSRLAALNLRDSKIYDSEATLYSAASGIVNDIRENSKVPDEGYYSYSGIIMFADYLADYLSKYEVEGDTVIHRTQKASRAIVQAIQFITLPADRLSDSIATKLYAANEAIVEYGSGEQFDLHLTNLNQYLSVDEQFFVPVIKHFQNCVRQLKEKEQAAVQALAEEANLTDEESMVA